MSLRGWTVPICQLVRCTYILVYPIMHDAICARCIPWHVIHFNVHMHVRVFNVTTFFPVCDPEDLRVALPSNDSWSDMMITADGLGLFTFSEGNVTFDGVSYRSVATYTTTGDYYVNGEQSFQTNCQSDEWMPTARITFIGKCLHTDYHDIMGIHIK